MHINSPYLTLSRHLKFITITEINKINILCVINIQFTYYGYMIYEFIQKFYVFFKSVINYTDVFFNILLQINFNRIFVMIISIELWKYLVLLQLVKEENLICTYLIYNWTQYCVIDDALLLEEFLPVEYSWNMYEMRHFRIIIYLILFFKLNYTYCKYLLVKKNDALQHRNRNEKEKKYGPIFG